MRKDSEGDRSMDDANGNADAVIKIMENEIRTTYKHLSFADGAKRIVLGGKSQGAMLTLWMTLMKLDYTLGGAAVCSGYPLTPLNDLLKKHVD